MESARIEGTPLFIEIEGCTFNLDPEAGSSQGALSNERGSCTWDLTWTPVDGLLGAPMSIFPVSLDAAHRTAQGEDSHSASSTGFQRNHGVVR